MVSYIIEKGRGEVMIKEVMFLIIPSRKVLANDGRWPSLLHSASRDTLVFFAISFVHLIYSRNCVVSL